MPSSMQGRSTGSICCLVLIAFLGLSAQNELASKDLNQSPFNRSNIESETLPSDSEQVSATEDSVLVNDDETSENDVSSESRSGVYTNAQKNFDSAIAVIQAQEQHGTTQDSPYSVSSLRIDPNSNNFSEDQNSINNFTDKVVDRDVGSQIHQEPEWLRRASSFYQPDFSRKLVPRGERILLELVPGAENIITCQLEGEFHSLQTPWKECLLCVCMRERGRVQPVCASCAGCAAQAALPDLPLINRPGLDVQLPGDVESCAPLPFGMQFEHPLNPCQICICQREPLKQNGLFVSCIQDTNCVKPLELPLLPPLPNPPAPIPTKLCTKFPKEVLFPHPTDICRACKCLEFVSPFGIQEQQILCTPDPYCGEAEPLTFPPKTTLIEPYPGLAKLLGVPAANEPADLIPFFEVDANLVPYDTKILSRPDETQAVLFGVADTLIPSLDQSNRPQLRPEIGLPAIPQPLSFETLTLSKHLPDSPVLTPSIGAPILPEVLTLEPSGLPELSPETSVSDILLFPQQPGLLELQPDQILALIAQVDSLEPSIVSPVKTGEKPVLQQHLPWPPKTVPGFIKPENGPLLGTPPHKSCEPYPANVPFQHPWDDCQLCVCTQYIVPGHISIEVNCYTKRECCVIPTDSQLSLPGPIKNGLIANSSYLVQSQKKLDQTQQLQILDALCELKTFGVQFESPRDACRLCVCRPIGRFVVPVCFHKPLCKPKTAPASLGLVVYLAEPQCRSKSPDKPFVVGCSVCVCQVVFNYVIAKCVRQPGCKEILEDNFSNLEVQLSAGAQNVDPGLGQSGEYSHVYINSAFPASIANVEPFVSSAQSLAQTSSINSNTKLKGNNYISYGQNPLNQNSENLQVSNLTPDEEISNLISLYNKKFTGYNNAVQDEDPLTTQHLPQVQMTQSSGQGTIDSAAAFIEFINGPHKNEFNKHPQKQQQDVSFEASSLYYPPKNYGYITEQTQNLHQNLNGLKSTGLTGLESQTLSYWPTLPPTYLPSSNSFSVPSSSLTPFTQKTTHFTPTFSTWDSTTLATNLGESSNSAWLQAAASTGGKNAIVTRTGRGQCQYVGDMYHHRCRACYCFADESGAAGDIYSMCLGNPCH